MLHGFISYSHDNHVMRDGLLRHLAATEERGHVKFWVDKTITAGTAWRQEIEDRIKESQIFLMLVSASFNGSNYIRTVEWPLIRDQVAATTGLVVPLALRTCDWLSWLEDINAVPVHGGKIKPISRWKPHDDGYSLAREQLLAAMDSHFPGWRPVRP